MQNIIFYLLLSIIYKSYKCIDFYMGFVSGVTNKPNQKNRTFVSLGKS